jgi:hypothetical protein
MHGEFTLSECAAAFLRAWLIALNAAFAAQPTGNSIFFGWRLFPRAEAYLILANGVKWSGAADDATPLTSLKLIAAFWDKSVVPGRTRKRLFSE